MNNIIMFLKIFDRIRISRILLALLILLISQNNIFSQRLENEPIHHHQPLSIIPQSPEAATLGKFSDFPTVNASGLPDITIPIYNLDYKGFELPITLSYHTSGIKVDDIPTIVGLNWNLNAESTIFRTVNGRPDEIGWLVCEYTSEFIDSMNTYYEQYQGNLMGFYEASRDVSADIFNISLPNFSGKFFFTRDGDIIISGNDPIRIESDIENVPSDFGFEVIDNQGNTFYFSPKENTTIEKFDQNGNNIFSFDYINLGTITGWKVDSIRLLSNDMIFFYYKEYNYSYNLWASDSYTVRNAVGPTCGDVETNSFVSTIHTMTNITSYVLDSIITSNQSISFIYNETNGELTELGIYLEKILIKDLTDFSNQFIVKGIDLLYDHYTGDQRLRLIGLDFLGSDSTGDLKKFRFNYDDGPLPSIGDPGRDIFGYQNSNTKSPLIPYNDNCSNPNPFTYPYNPAADREVDTIMIKKGILNEIVYPTGGKLRFLFEANMESNENFTAYGPGLRIKEKRFYDSNNELLNGQKYEYSGLISYPYTHYANNYCAFQDKYWGLDYPKIRTYSSSPVLKNLHETEAGTVSGLFYQKIKITEIDRLDNEGTLIEEFYNGFFDVNVIKPYLIKKQLYDKDLNIVREEIFNHERTENNQKNWFFNNSWSIYWWDGVDCLEQKYYQALGSYFFRVPKLQRIEQTTIDYFYDDSLNQKDSIIIQNIKYFNSFNLLSKIENNNSSDGKEIKTFKYADDYELNYQWLNNLTKDQKHAVGIPIDIRTYVEKDNVLYLIDGITNKYNDCGKIQEQYNFYSDIPDSTLAWSPDIFLSPDFELENIYSYDNFHNLIELKTRNRDISFIWGYNYTYPVAKIENATFDEVEAALSVSIESLQTKTNDELEDIFDELRNSLNNAMITSYTYKPLVGILKVIDPRGRKINYEYDGLNRLIRIKDHDGKILEEYQYHYAEPGD